MSIEPTTDELELGPVLTALADPHRRRVIQDLIEDSTGAERTCTSFGLPVSKSTRSHHFKVLREAGLVHQVDRGNMSGVTLRREEIESRFPGLLELLRSEPVEP
ncbi:ArsR/SmtB family transcription factor [Naumannella halotolerans]|uniref:DNA-binding transcriptional ArsR family regulator n=1 Tax=Naumannella halotolerans TaxID=993414 RepID=A0A4R7J973_9ACTN|nr:helix-turn-helix domain-containing protein [Naumannella halotolerans]TDT34061.1 DNA-binding transcriptional ArsR family regulator [Naumannella halotolerans]